MPRTYVIGDVHGCIDELQELVGMLNLTSTDRLIFIGDLIDRGPNSAAVVRQVVKWSKEVEVKLVLGNHEEKFLRYVKHVRSGSGQEKEMTGTEEFPTLLATISENEFEFLQQSFYSLHLPEYNVLLVHGGIWHTISFPMPATHPFRPSSSQVIKQLPLLTKVRYLSPEGKFIALGEESPNDNFWAEKYDGAHGHVYFGHQPFIQSSPKQFPFATGIDTGCVYGGWLSAVELSSAGATYTSVPAKTKYVIR
jgi:serine/threonine protein phosphatase 1